MDAECSLILGAQDQDSLGYRSFPANVSALIRYFKQSLFMRNWIKQANAVT